MLRAIESEKNGVLVSGQAANSVDQAQDKDKLDLVEMAQWHPFGGSKGPGGKTAVADTKNLPETSLNFQLHGILFIEGTTIPAFALIKLADAPEKVFAVGEELTGGVRLVAIQDDRVILDRGGRLETLKLPRGVLQIRDPDA
ncbi:MAG: ral secretion pathway protein C [Magnetococcales bacterium]|nr:ral secretion pathway protein C [Magnetococcales bacterium]